MQRLNRDAIIAIILLAFCGVFFWASFDIRQPDYGVLMPSTWPRVILGVMTFLSVLYLIQSLSLGQEEIEDDQYDAEHTRKPGFRGWLEHWRNPLWCFFLFFLYLLTLPVLGMLIGGITFVYVLLGMLGGWDGNKPVVHGVIAICAIGVMWSVFTFGLGVLLPPGMILGRF
ncbi:MAG: tripartite tricarboxylate transporter TctB family protein [Alphaproteobacteria bacterium]|nr:tripartite tricarboxylate transporter TctB family protein [Alphaproteobacteria bacterium]